MNDSSLKNITKLTQQIIYRVSTGVLTITSSSFYSKLFIGIPFRLCLSVNIVRETIHAPPPPQTIVTNPPPT